jgi:hypothetical protein
MVYVNIVCFISATEYKEFHEVYSPVTLFFSAPKFNISGLVIINKQGAGYFYHFAAVFEIAVFSGVIKSMVIRIGVR